MDKYKPFFVRGFNNYDVRVASDDAGTSPGEEPSMTQQHFRDECDINVIVERFGLLGQVPTDVRAPMYGDFTGVSDYRSALHAIMEAEDSFMQLPPAVRLKFDNDPSKFVDFCSDAGNIDAMRDMGLAVRKESSNVGVSGVGSVVGGKVGASGEVSGGNKGSVGGREGGSGSVGGEGR